MRPLLIAALILLAGLAISSSELQAQDSSIVARYDSLSRRMLQVRHPCPDPVPTGWIASDTANASGIRCSLIAAAARGANDAMLDRRRPQFDPRAVPCATLTTGKPLRDRGPVWEISFYIDSMRGAILTVDNTGATITGMMMVPIPVPMATACPRRG